jgi:hypothetical protein
VRHALVWTGTPDSVIDLNQYLPAGYTHGVATGVDANGNVVGYAYNMAPVGTAMPADAIAVVFAPGQAPAATLSSISLNSTNVAPGAAIQVTVSLNGAAPTGGVNVSFLSTNTALVPTPTAVIIPEGQTSSTFSIVAGGTGLQVPIALRLFATDGTTSKSSTFTITPIVNLTGLTINSVEGGFGTVGTVSVGIPAQAGGAVISLTSGSTLATVPASVTLPLGSTQLSFNITTSPVSALTSVPVTATFNGQTISATLSLSPAPVVAVSSVSIPPVVGGQSTTGTVTLNNFPRGAEGAVITLTSGDPATLQVPATVTIPQYGYSVTFPVTTVVVPGQKGVSVKASYNGSNVTTTVSVQPIPTVTITQADYLTDTHMFKVKASVTFANANSIMTYGTDPLSAPIGTMQIELGVFTGSTILATAPQFATVWSSDGGMATVKVTQKLSSAATGGGGGGGGGTATGGGGGGGSTSTTYKLSISKNGKGTVNVSPLAASYAPGTVVTLTAVPDPGSPWIGWAGACSGTSITCTVTMNANLSVTANFK